MKINIYIEYEDSIVDFNELSAEEQKKLANELNAKAMKTLGYVPVGKKAETV